MIRILTTSYNTKKYIGNTISSLRQQNFKDWKCYITDDMSTDDTVEYVTELIEGDDRFELIDNKEKWYQPGNYWQVAQKEEIGDEDIMINLDGDDWLPDTGTLTRINQYYQDPNIWMSCGQFLGYHGGDKYVKGFASKPDFSKLRQVRWTSTAMRTYKAWLFRKIKVEDLKGPTGNFWEVTGDLAIMYPMLEMAGENRVLYTDDINYIYNKCNDLNDYKVNLHQQLHYAQLIRGKEPYDYITSH